MRKGVLKFLAHFLICSALIMAGCDDSTNDVKPDGGSPDTLSKDALPPDATASKDTAKLETQADKPLSPDVNAGDVAGDTDNLDTPLPPDVSQSDAPLQETGVSDAGMDS
jgi:hypothetical protein